MIRLEESEYTSLNFRPKPGTVLNLCIGKPNLYRSYRLASLSRESAHSSDLPCVRCIRIWMPNVIAT